MPQICLHHWGYNQEGFGVAPQDGAADAGREALQLFRKAWWGNGWNINIYQHYNIANSWFRRTWNLKETIYIYITYIWLIIKYQFACKVWTVSKHYQHKRSKWFVAEDSDTRPNDGVWKLLNCAWEKSGPLVFNRAWEVLTAIENHRSFPHWFSWMFPTKPVSHRDSHEHVV